MLLPLQPGSAPASAPGCTTWGQLQLSCGTCPLHGCGLSTVSLRPLPPPVLPAWNVLIIPLSWDDLCAGPLPPPHTHPPSTALPPPRMVGQPPQQTKQASGCELSLDSMLVKSQSHYVTDRIKELNTAFYLWQIIFAFL